MLTSQSRCLGISLGPCRPAREVSPEESVADAGWTPNGNSYLTNISRILYTTCKQKERKPVANKHGGQQLRRRQRSRTKAFSRQRAAGAGAANGQTLQVPPLRHLLLETNGDYGAFQFRTSVLEPEYDHLLNHEPE